jgi:hypothetical protein
VLRSSKPTGGAITFWNTPERGDAVSSPAISMKLVLQSAIVFFGTLLAAALVALGEPGTAEVQMVVQTPPAAETVVGLLGLDE